MNKIKLLLVLLLIAATTIPATAHDFDVNGIYYNKNSDGTSVSVTYKGDYYSSFDNEYSGSVTIPSSVTYSGKTYSVTSIEGRAFSDCSGLTSVNIPNSVTSIGYSAFYRCTGLTSVTIPNSVTSIGDWAFEDCTGLKSMKVEAGNTIYDSRNDCNAIIETSTNTLLFGCQNTIIPNSVTSIGNSAFEDCTGLTSITIPNSVTSIGDWAFYGCTGLTSVTIPNSVTSIGEYAFSYCSGLTSVNIPNSVTSIGDVAFSHCTGLTSVTIGNSVTSIGIAAFSGCSRLTSVTIGNSVTSIGRSAFSDCSGLTSVTIGNSVTSIGDWAFEDCTGLTSVTIPNSVTSIGEDAFNRCSNLIKSAYPNHLSNPFNNGIAIAYPSDGIIESDNTIYNSDKSSLYFVPWTAKEMSIPSTVTSIGNNAFYYCYRLTSVTIPNSVTSIGSYAFYGCTGLTSVHYNAENATSISSSWLYNCSNITTFMIGDNVKTIPAYLCYGLSKIESITIPNSVTSIGNSAFEDCTGLTSITIPNSVTSIGNSAFSGCSNATIYAFPNPYLTLKNSDKSWKQLVLVGGPCYYFNVYNLHQESIDFTINFNNSYNPAPEGYESIQAIEGGVTYNGKYYPCNSEGKVTINNLKANTSYYTIGCYTKYLNGAIALDEKNFTTSDLNLNVIQEASPTSISAQFSYKLDDAKFDTEYITYKGEKIPGNKLLLTGMKPNTTVKASYTVNTKGGSTETKVFSINTSSNLTLTILKPKCVSSTCAVVAAETNISEAETSAGFQWKKYDAPESLEPNEGYALIFEGRLEGYIKNLQPTFYYNVRAFYKSADGTYYYSDWKTFDPSDFSYFEPTVHTYPVSEVTSSSATVKGTALPGSDEISKQGIEYWVSGSNNAPKKVMSPMVVTETEGVNTIFSSGQVMIVTIDQLEPETTYCYRAFVTTQAGTTYGEEQTFTTEKPVCSLGDVNADGVINVSDVTAIVSHILGIASYDESLCDVNADGVINVSDVTGIISIILGE